MNTVDERIAHEMEKLEQLKRIKRAHDIRMKKQQDALNTRRKMIVGTLVEKYFPEVLQYQPRKSNAATDEEFTPVENFLMLLADDKQYISHIKAALNASEGDV